MKNLTLLLSLLFILPIVAQNKSEKVDISWGTEQKNSKRDEMSGIIGSDESGFYAMRTQIRFSGGYIFEHYNTKMNLTKSEEFDLDKHFYLVDVLFLNDELYILSGEIDKKSESNNLYVQKLNKKTLKTTGTAKRIARIDFSNFSKRNSGGYEIQLSRDESKVLIYYALPYDKKERESIGMAVFTSNFEKLWEKTSELPYLEELFQVTDYDVSNNGEVYILSKLYKDKVKNSRKGEPNYSYLVLNYEENNSNPNEYKINVPGKYLTDMKVAVNDKNDIICAGFYSENGTYSIEGSYFLRINGETKDIETKTFEKFGIDFITQNLTEKQEKKTKKRNAKGKSVELYQYDIDNIILKSDGGVVLVGEQFFIRERVSQVSNGNGGYSTRVTYEYYYNDIIVINFDGTGKMVWTEKIAKRQRTINDRGYYSSYALAIQNDQLFFIFNDHPENLLVNKGDKLKYYRGGKKSMVVLVEMDSDGRQVKEALYAGRDAETSARPKVSKQIDDDELILYGIRGKTNQFALIKFL